ncbi:MAG: septum formation family protein [Candidatus Limnocylindria bacterium]
MARFLRSAAIAVAAVVLAACNLIPGGNQVSAFDLDPGVCFNDVEGTEVGSVPTVPCDQPHDNEVFEVVNYPAGGDEPYPGDSTMQSYAEQECKGLFDEYVGLDYDSSEFYLLPITPSEGTWGDGDREIICSLYEPGEKLTGSARGARR